MAQRDSQTNEAGSPVGAAGEPQLSLLKALADGTRLRMIRVLYRSELNVQELAGILEVAQPSVSRHLAALRGADLVQDRREGTKVYCSLHVPDALPQPLADYLEEIGRSQHPDLERLEVCLRARSDEARSFADRSAGQWDDIGRRLHSSAASMLALAGLVPPGLRIADLGTGTGLLLPVLSELADQVYAVDQSAEMLRRVRERCGRLGLENVTPVQCSIEALEGRLPACDALLLHFVLHQVAEPKRLLSALATLLRPAGRVVIVDRLHHADEQARTTYGSLWLGFRQEQIQGWLAEAGFDPVCWRELAGGAEDQSPGLFVASASVAGREDQVK